MCRHCTVNRSFYHTTRTVIAIQYFQKPCQFFVDASSTEILLCVIATQYASKFRAGSFLFLERYLNGDTYAMSKAGRTTTTIDIDGKKEARSKPTNTNTTKIHRETQMQERYHYERKHKRLRSVDLLGYILSMLIKLCVPGRCSDTYSTVYA